MTQEIWAVAPGFPNYDVSNTGRVRRNKPGCGTYVGRIVQGAVDKYGYRTVGIQRERKTWNIAVHCLVAKAFIGPRPEGYEVAHNDGNKFNNHIDNLRYATSLENKADSLRHGVTAKGERNGGGGKLSEEQARDIKYSTTSVKEISEMYPISRRMVWNIRSGKNWTHV